MSRHLLPISFLMAVSLSGCPSLSDVAENVTGEIQKLKIVYQEGIDTDFFSFSEDGRMYAVGDEYRGVKLFRTEDNAPLEHHYPKKIKDPTLPADIMNTTPSAYMEGLGFSGSNTWFFGGKLIGEVRGSTDSYFFSIRSINPSREIAVFEVGGKRFLSNSNYILFRIGLYDWRTGKSYPVKTYPATFERYGGPISPRILLTSGNLVLSIQKDQKGIMINDPIKDETEIWELDINGYHKMVVTADDKYLVNVTGRRCTLWKWPERQEVGHCSPRLYGESFDKWDMALAPDGKTFAFAVDSAVRVYRTEPFQLLFETGVTGGVGTVAVSSDGFLAVADHRGFLSVWDITTGEIVGRNRFFEDGQYTAFGPMLVFQPNGNRLAVGWRGLTFLEVPVRGKP